MAPALFVVTVFASAALVFMVEPMMAKLVLPLLGGTAAVWNTSLAFFQAALLAGYVYAHLLQRARSIRAQIVVHSGVLIIAALVLPLRVSAVLGDPRPDAPALWLVGVLALSVGAPFAALSATAPLVQAWHARTYRAEEAREPYALYAASNLGSLLALLAYPVVVEPLVTLQGQTLGWTVGYAVFFVLLMMLGLSLWRGAPRVRSAPQADAAAPQISWRDRAIWVGLAALPSSLMLGVTNYITTDLGSAPFMWVAPLALYLATFIVAFQSKPWLKRGVVLLLQAIALPVCAAFIHFWTRNFLQEAGLHLATFFLTALVCHQALVARRPAPARLTDFYICMSLGGVLGGSFNAFVAPLIFNTVAEYPLVLVLCCLARPWGFGEAPRTQTWIAVGLGLAGAVIAFLLVQTPAPLWPLEYRLIGHTKPLDVAAPVLGLTVVMAFLLRGRLWTFLPMVLVLIVTAERISDRSDVIGTWRSFFGVVRETRGHVARLGGEVRMLAHGTTLHGAQALDPAHRCQPLVYYAHETPIGQVFDAKQAAKPAVTIGAVGLGAGTVAAYVRRGDALNFFEIDPLVFRLSTADKVFTYTSQCAKGQLGYVLGDARLTMNREPAGRYDILLIDAFTSDSVPAHLLTVEAVRMYLTKLKPDGVLILHLSNRNLDLIRPAEAVALAAGGHALYQNHDTLPGLPELWDTAEDAVIVTRSEAALAPFKADSVWQPVQPAGVAPWTDNYTNLFGAMVRRMRDQWTGRGRQG
ncbi:MAG TPA: fused MFS/spermidine synthase [Caulobacteraceae bacterium]